MSTSRTMDFGISERTAIVTGGGQGLGRAYCLGLAEQGAQVAVVDRNAQTAAHVAAEIEATGGNALAVAADVSDEDAVAQMVARVAAELGSPTLLVNNAGLLASLTLKASVDISIREWDEVMAVNVRGTFLCCRACIPAMSAEGYGKIVNISSNTVCIGRAGYPHYVTSKMALLGLTRALASELGPAGIRVNAILPGVVQTEVERGTITPALLDQVAGMTALRRREEPRDLADAVLYLCSPASDFVTGQSLIVDGGFCFG